MYAVVVCVVNYFYTCRNSSIIATIANLGDQSNFPPYFPRVRSLIFPTLARSGVNYPENARLDWTVTVVWRKFPVTVLLGFKITGK